MSFSLGEIAEHIGLEPETSLDEALAAVSITGVNSPLHASSSEITFIASETYLDALKDTKAAAVIISPAMAGLSPVPTIQHSNPYMAYAQVTALFAPASALKGIHSSAVVEEGVKIGSNVRIGANVVIAEGAEIGDDVIIDANASIGANGKIGDRTRIYPNVSIYHDVSLGADCIVHSGTVIGSDGFGFAPSASGWVKIYQLGTVRVGNSVEIGANTAIDRGALGDTIIGDGVKIDNLVMMAHNVQVGEHTAIAGQVGVAGSTKIGKNCMFAGQAGVVGHVELADNVIVTGQGMITKSIEQAGSYSSGTSFSDTRSWRKNAVRFNLLDALYKRLIKLEKQVNKNN